LTLTNVFAYLKTRFGHDELITPNLDGLIYNSLIRKTLIEMKERIEKETKVKVLERHLSLHELISAKRERRMKELISVGYHSMTNSLIQSISKLAYKD
jgi:branched-subunit amino acid aminotransferase/4-amino-4-deoxychorismate lyase